MAKTDLTKQHKAYYSAKNKPELLTIEKAQFLSITGKGDPSEPEYADTLQALYTTAYTLKFIYKKLNNDFIIAKLQGQWSFDEKKYKNISMEDAPTIIPRSEWYYRMLLRMPDFVAKEDVTAAVQAVINKKKLSKAKNVTLYEMEEGKVVQILHTGPFSKEPESLNQLKAFMLANNLQKNGLHHEIYLTDFRKTESDKLKTILREPVK